MRCEIILNELVVLPDNQTELYAVKKWLVEHPMKCVTIDFIDPDDI